MSVRIEWPTEHVAELIMDRPEALNAVSTEQARAIEVACRELTSSAHCRVVVLASAVDRAFCVGADLKERNGFSDEQLAAHRPISRAAYEAVRSLPMPVIAAVDGFALGGGCELALSADLIVAGEAAVFGLPEVSVGLVPGGGGTQLLSRRIGFNRALDLILTARRLSGADAAAIGLCDRLVPAGRARSAARTLAETIVEHSPVAVRAAKSALRAGFDLPLVEALQVEDRAWQRAAFSPDRIEGIAAFTEKRRPAWTNDS